MATEVWIAVIAAIPTIATLIFSQFGIKRKAEVDYIIRLEKRLKECEDDRDKLWKVIRQLQKINGIKNEGE